MRINTEAYLPTPARAHTHTHTSVSHCIMSVMHTAYTCTLTPLYLEEFHHVLML